MSPYKAMFKLKSDIDYKDALSITELKKELGTDNEPDEIETIKEEENEEEDN